MGVMTKQQNEARECTSESANENDTIDERAHTSLEQQRSPSQKISKEPCTNTPMYHRNAPSIPFLTLMLSMVVAVMAAAMDEHLIESMSATATASAGFAATSDEGYHHYDGAYEESSSFSHARMAMPEGGASFTSFAAEPPHNSFSPSQSPSRSFTGAESNTLGEKVLHSLSEQQQQEQLQAKVGDNGDNNEHETTQMLVHTGNMEVLSNNRVHDDATHIIGSLETIGGYIESRSMYIEQLYHKPECRSESFYVDTKRGKCARTVISLNARIPSVHFFAFQDTIKQIFGADNILSLSTSSRDVSTEYIDANARVDTLEKSRAAIEKILQQANNVGEVMSVQRELNRVTEQLESKKSRALHLKKKASMSTLMIMLKETLPEDDNPPPDKEPKAWNPKDTFERALKHLLQLVCIFGDISVYALVCFVPCFICVQLGAVLVKKLFQRGQNVASCSSSQGYSSFSQDL